MSALAVTVQVHAEENLSPSIAVEKNEPFQINIWLHGNIL